MSNLQTIYQKLFAIVLLGLFIFPLNLVAQTTLDPEVYDEDGFLLTDDELVSDENSEEIENILKAQEEVSKTLNTNGVTEGEIVSCFDYYTFGDIKVNLTANFDSYEAGEPVMIQGLITNDNRFPIVGLDVRARIIKDTPNPDYSRSEIMSLDEFDIVENISIDANSSYEVSFNYLLPLNTPAGEYQVLFFAYNEDRFNQAGLSFTNDITASKLSFEVIGTNPEFTYLDQTRIVVGDQEHNVMAFMTQHEKDEQVITQIPLVNPTMTEREMKVTYDLYAWDSVNSNNKISTKSESVTVPANDETLLSYSVDNATVPVYYLVITAEPLVQGDTNVLKEKTISNVRFVVNDLNYPRINSMGIDAYPLIKGEETTLFTCFHNGSNGIDTTNTRIETILTNDKGRVIARSEYDGNFISDISAIATKFIPKSNFTELTITSRLISTDGVELDKVESVYSCKDINPDYCEETETNLLVISTILIGLLGLGFLIQRKNLFGIKNLRV